jgi:hypothetical protein
MLTAPGIFMICKPPKSPEGGIVQFDVIQLNIFRFLFLG